MRGMNGYWILDFRYRIHQAVSAILFKIIMKAANSTQYPISNIQFFSSYQSYNPFIEKSLAGIINSMYDPNISICGL